MPPWFCLTHRHVPVEAGEKGFLSGLCRQSTVVGLGRGGTPQGRVMALGIVKRHPPGNHLLGLEAVRELMQVDGLVLEGASQALDEDVAHAPARVVHGDGNPRVLEHGGKFQAGELTALVGVEYLGAVVARQGVCEGIGAVAGIEGFEEPEGEHPRVVQCITATRYGKPFWTGM